jgi:hypothetical protein
MATANKETEAYLNKFDAAFLELCDVAKHKNELQFVMALCPEFRGEQGPGWCTWEESCRAYDDYMKFIEEGEMTSIKVRVALSFYCHLSEASGLYECPKNLLRIAGGETYSMWPFLELNKKHAETGKVVAPNANKVFRDLIGHAKSLGFLDLADVLRDAFDPDIRNGYAHADYIVWTDGLRLSRQSGGHPKVISWDAFDQAFLKAINVFTIIRETIREKLSDYSTPKILIGNFGTGPNFEWEVKLDKEGRLSISSSSQRIL